MRSLFPESVEENNKKPPLGSVHALIESGSISAEDDVKPHAEGGGFEPRPWCGKSGGEAASPARL